MAEKISRNDLTVGAWRNGLHPKLAAEVKGAEDRRASGFRLLPFESTVVELVDLLDAYDQLAPEFLDTVDSLTLIGEATAEGQVVTFDPPLAKGDKLVIEETAAL